MIKIMMITSIVATDFLSLFINIIFYYYHYHIDWYHMSLISPVWEIKRNGNILVFEELYSKDHFLSIKMYTNLNVLLWLWLYWLYCTLDDYSSICLSINLKNPCSVFICHTNSHFLSKRHGLSLASKKVNASHVKKIKRLFISHLSMLPSKSIVLCFINSFEPTHKRYTPLYNLIPFSHASHYKVILKYAANGQMKGFQNKIQEAVGILPNRRWIAD